MKLVDFSNAKEIYQKYYRRNADRRGQKRVLYGDIRKEI